MDRFEAAAPNFVPRYLENPKIENNVGGFIVKEYLDGVSVVIDINSESTDIETRFPDGSLHYEDSVEGPPEYIEHGHEDRPINN